MNQDQLTSLVRSVLKIVGTALAAHGLSKEANLVNGEDVAGVVIAFASLVWSHYNHSAPPTPPQTAVNPPKTP
jgi:hypothetical protein